MTTLLLSAPDKNADLRKLAHQALDAMLDHRVLMMSAGTIEEDKFDMSVQVRQHGEPTPDVETSTIWEFDLVFDNRTDEWVLDESGVTRHIHIQNSKGQRTNVLTQHSRNIFLQLLSK